MLKDWEHSRDPQKQYEDWRQCQNKRERAQYGLFLSQRWLTYTLINMDKGFHGNKLPHTTELFNLAGNYNKNQQLEAKTRHIPAENKVQIIKSKDD